MTALEAQGVCFAYGSTSVLEGVDLTVEEHSITAVLGASGSGKTTLLRVLAGFARATSGTVRLSGTVIDDGKLHLPPERRGLGYVAQEGALFPHLSVAGNVAFGLRHRHRQGQRVAELLDMVGLAGLGARYPHELSGGQQQRVALARALALRPAVVLLDEPFSSLDAALRVSVRADIVDTLHASGAAVVLVTHDQQEALSVADQVAVLRNGRVAQLGHPRDIYRRPVDAEMAQFLGDANLLDAQVTDGQAVTLLGRLDIDFPSNGRGTVLIRPEQLTLVSGSGGPGCAGRVSAQTYHGHDSLVDVVLQDPAGPLVRVRVPGTAVFAIGTDVAVSAAGPVQFWPHA